MSLDTGKIWDLVHPSDALKQSSQDYDFVSLKTIYGPAES